MSNNADNRSPFLANFEQLEATLNGDASTGIHQIRRAGIERFNQLGLPTNRDEEWRYTSLVPLTERTFHRASSATTTAAVRKTLSYGFDDPESDRLVFVNGEYIQEFSRIGELPRGASVTNLAAAIVGESQEIERLFTDSPALRNDAFAALNTAFIRDGACIRLADGCVLERPIHLLFVSTSEGDGATASHPRNIIVLGKDARATVIEEYAGSDGERYFTNPVTDIVVGEGGELNHCKLQHESAEAIHIGNLVARQASRSNLTTVSVCFGSALVRNTSSTILGGEYAHCTMDGLYVANGTQQVDNHTTIDHAAPNCTSHELYKGVLDEKGRGVFSGKIIVRQDAQKTDSKQSNMNLLLSDDAVIDTKPQLEIFADDVKCTHGATIGQLNDDAIFYLRARGVGITEARQMLTYAFATDIIDRIADEPAREHLDAILARRLKQSSE